MWTTLQEAWNNIDAQVLTNLVKRMLRLCKAVIKAKEGHFNEKKLPGF